MYIEPLNLFASPAIPQSQVSYKSSANMCTLDKQAAHCIMTLPFMAKFKQKLKTSLTGSRTSHVDACTSFEHTHPSCAHKVLQMSLSHWVKFEPKFNAQIVHQCIVFSLWPMPINQTIFHNRGAHDNPYLALFGPLSLVLLAIKINTTNVKPYQIWQI